MPALFHGSLLSAAAPSRRSISVIDQSGSTSRSNAPEGGAHDAGADQHDVGLRVASRWSLTPDRLPFAVRAPLVPCSQVIPRATVSSPAQPRVEASATAMVTGVTAWEPDVLTGYQQRTIELGADPDGEGDLVATLVRRGQPARAGRAPCCWCTATPTTSSTPNWRTVSPPAASRSTRSTCTSADARGAHGQTPHFTTDLARYDTELERALDLIADESGGAGVCVYGHSAGGLIVTLWLDRLRGAVSRPPRGGRPGAQQPVAGPARSGDPAHRAHLGGADRTGAAAQDTRGPRPAPRAATAPRCTGTTAATSTTTWTGNRWRLPRHVRLDPCRAPRPGPAAPRPRRRRAEPHPALRPQRARGTRRRPRLRSSAATPCSTSTRSPAGPDASAAPHHDRADRRRQARRVPVAARTARRGLPRTRPVVGPASGICNDGTSTTSTTDSSERRGP